MLSAAELEQQLLRFTRERLAEPEVSTSITVDTRLFEDRVIDSLKVLELIAFVQSALERKIPDAQIVLANFRTIATIARVFTGGEPVATLRKVRRPRVAAREPAGGGGSAVRELMRRGEMQLTAEGGLQLRGPVADLLDYFDRTAHCWALALGATDAVFPEEISPTALERAGFMAAFPQKVVWAGHVARPPAVCYHHYPHFADGVLDRWGSLVTAVGRCYRNEFDARSTHPAERLSAFTMREVIAIGKANVVEGLRTDMMERVTRWMKEIGVDGFIETATDPFFTTESKGRLLMQQMLPLKYELRLRVDESGRTVAAASFNNHQDHFGKAFSIQFPSGEPAHSGCVAFGWERWVIAFVNQHGPNEADWPASTRANYVAATA